MLFFYPASFVDLQYSTMALFFTEKCHLAQGGSDRFAAEQLLHFLVQEHRDVLSDPHHTFDTSRILECLHCYSPQKVSLLLIHSN